MSHSFGRQRMPRFASLAAIALALVASAAVSATTATAAIAAARPAATFRSAPARDVSRIARPGASPRSGTENTILASDNWSGYVATGTTYTSVTASWVQPAVSCTSNGIVGTWVGLDGDGNGTVEQTGTAVSCATGSPQYSAWWEFYPDPSVTYAEPVSPGDTLVASVTYLGSDEYSLKLADITRNWSENTPLSAVADNSSAEIITEAADNSAGQQTALPDFTAAQFSDTAINGESLQAANADEMEMLNSYGSAIAYPTAVNSSGAFTDFYSGGLGSAAAAALPGSDGDLYTYSSAGLDGTSEAIRSGTSPAITELSNGTYEMAYQSTSGYLIVTGSGVTTNTGLAMKAATSPAIAGSPYGGYEVAYQASSGSLWTYTTSGATNQSQGMLPGTSPAIAALSTGGYEMAFQANTGILILYGSGGDINTSLGMRSGTSPAIAASPRGGFEAAMQANTGVLWTYGTNGTSDLGLGMAAGTSPAIAGLTTSGYEMAIQANTGVLLVYGNAADLNTGIGMAAGTSPAIAATPGGGYETAFQASTSAFTLWGTAGNVATNQEMPSGASPSVAG
jgi:hypothetical protein